MARMKLRQGGAGRGSNDDGPLSANKYGDFLKYLSRNQNPWWLVDCHGANVNAIARIAKGQGVTAIVGGNWGSGRRTTVNRALAKAAVDLADTTGVILAPIELRAEMNDTYHNWLERLAGSLQRLLDEPMVPLLRDAHPDASSGKIIRPAIGTNLPEKSKLLIEELGSRVGTRLARSPMTGEETAQSHQRTSGQSTKLSAGVGVGVPPIASGQGGIEFHRNGAIADGDTRTKHIAEHLEESDRVFWQILGATKISEALSELKSQELRDYYLKRSFVHPDISWMSWPFDNMLSREAKYNIFKQKMDRHIHPVVVADLMGQNGCGKLFGNTVSFLKLLKDKNIPTILILHNEDFLFHKAAGYFPDAEHGRAHGAEIYVPLLTRSVASEACAKLVTNDAITRDQSQAVLDAFGGRMAFSNFWNRVHGSHAPKLPAPVAMAFDKLCERASRLGEVSRMDYLFHVSEDWYNYAKHTTIPFDQGYLLEMRYSAKPGQSRTDEMLDGERREHCTVFVEIMCDQGIFEPVETRDGLKFRFNHDYALGLN